MKTLVIYSSWGGHARKEAEKLAQARAADLVEVQDVKRPRSFAACMLRCPAAIGQKPGKVKPFTADFAAYDRIVIVGPIWASHPAPPVNSIIEQLPAGKEVELVMVSSGGTSEKAKVMAKVEGRGAKVAQYTDIATGESSERKQ